MGVIVYTELLKMKRSSMMKASILITVLASVFSVMPLFAADTTIKDFALLMRNILENNCIYFSPVLTTLLGSYMMEREITDNTLKNILLIPISFRNLLIGKLMVLFVLLMLFGLGNSVMGILLGLALKLPGISAANIFLWSFRLVLANILVFIAVLPITIIAACVQGAMLAGIAVSFVYGFLATIDWKPMNFYPVKAVMILADPIYENQYEWLHYSKAIAAVIIALVFLVSLVLISRVRLSGSKNKISGAARKRGW